MAQVNSIDKIVNSYFAALTKEEFTYKGISYLPKPLQVSPTLLRGFVCPEHCAGCCPRFSLDYLPTEEHPYPLSEKIVEFSGREITLFSDIQQTHEEHHCRHVDFQNGRCKIHGKQPFSCDFELIRTTIFTDPRRPNILGQRLFGRGWAMLRTDGERGACCVMLPYTEQHAIDVVRKLKRVQQWSDYFGITTWVPEILSCIFSGTLKKHAVLFTKHSSKGFDLL